MDGLGDVLKYLYSQFILRDCFGKIVPGIVLMCALLCVAFGARQASRLVKSTHRWKLRHIIIVVALSWPLGFVIQRVGNASTISRIDFSPQDYQLAIRTNATKPYSASRIYDVAIARSYTRYVDFFRVADEHQRLRQERLVIIKETTGNLALALGFAVFGLAVGVCVDWARASRQEKKSSKAPWRRFEVWSCGAVLIGLASVLQLSHREHSAKQQDYEERVLKAARSLTGSDMKNESQPAMVE